MSPSSRAYLGVDTGESLALLAVWPGQDPDALEPTWPVRAPVEAFRATSTAATIELENLARELLATCGRPPEASYLVRMGGTGRLRACELTAGLGLRGVVEPRNPCVLWSEGVLPAQIVREYVRPVPPPGSLDLHNLRGLFAELMEEAADEVQAMELDQDDSVLDRFIEVRYQGRPETLTIPVESLTEPARLLAPFHAAFTARFGPADDAVPVQILAARIRCILITFGRPDRPAVSAPAEPVPPPGWTRQVLQHGHVLWTPPG